MKRKISGSVGRLQAALTGSAREIVQALGFDGPQPDRNPVWLALAGLTPLDGDLLDAMVEGGEMSREEADAFAATAREGEALADLLRPLAWNGARPNKGAILTAYEVCQTACLDAGRGPIGTGDLGTIRQRWYYSKDPLAMGFKFAAQALEAHLVRSADIVLVPDEAALRRALDMGAAMPLYKHQWTKAGERELSDVLGRAPRVHVWPKAGWGRAYAVAQSGILADLVRDGLTYEELWVRDASRSVETNPPLVSGFHGVLALEKEGLFEHFEKFCAAAGVPVLISMSGANAFSAVEGILNDNFREWEGAYRPQPDNPLHVFAISDHDYYGHVPVQQGVVGQFGHYLPGAVRLWRVGVTPEQVRATGRSPAQAGYEFEHDYNSATAEWAEAEGVWVGDVCYGIEVEALEPGAYVEALIDCIVEALGGDEELRKRLAEMAEPDWHEAREEISSKAYHMSRAWKLLAALAEWSDGERYDAEQPINAWVHAAVGDPGDEDSWAGSPWMQERIQEFVAERADAMSVEDYKAHVLSQRWGAWRPAGSEEATRAVVGEFAATHGLEMREAAEDVDASRFGLLQALETVFGALEDFGLELAE